MISRSLTRIPKLIPALVAVLVLAACGSTSTSSSSTSSFPKLTLRMNHNITKDTYEGQAMDYFAKRVSDLTNGQVTVQVFHNAELGDDQASLTSVQTGTLDMSVDSLYENAITAGTVFDLPFLFPDEATWAKAVSGKAGQIVKDSATGTGLHLLGLWMGGWRDEYGNKQINGIADFKGLKIRTIQLKSYTELFKAIGAVPTPIAFSEVYLALQQHTVDAAETDLQSMYGAKHYEVTKYVALTHHGLSTTAMIINQQRWDGLPQNVKRTSSRRHSRTLSRWTSKNTTGNAKIQQQLKDKGMTINKPDTTAIRQIAKTIYPQLVTDSTQQKVLQAILSLSS